VNKFSKSIADPKEEILLIFRRNGLTMSRFAEELGVHTSAVSQWFSGKSTSARIEAAATKRAEELVRRRPEVNRG